MLANEPAARLRFREFEVDLQAVSLSRNGIPLQASEKAVRRPGCAARASGPAGDARCAGAADLAVEHLCRLRSQPQHRDQQAASRTE
jgi:hypothetical protein